MCCATSFTTAHNAFCPPPATPQVADTAGNKATAKRLVNVLCAEGESVCCGEKKRRPEDRVCKDAAGLSCTRGAYSGCCSLQLLYVSAFTRNDNDKKYMLMRLRKMVRRVANGRFINNVIMWLLAGGICVGSGLKSGPVVPMTSNEINAPPTITLIGSSVLSITSGSDYVKCAPNAAVDTVCERGARAQDAEDGMLQLVLRIKPSGDASNCVCGMGENACKMVCAALLLTNVVYLGDLCMPLILSLFTARVHACR